MLWVAFVLIFAGAIDPALYEWNLYRLRGEVLKTFEFERKRLSQIVYYAEGLHKAPIADIDAVVALEQAIDTLKKEIRESDHPDNMERTIPALYSLVRFFIIGSDLSFPEGLVVLAKINRSESLYFQERSHVILPLLKKLKRMRAEHLGLKVIEAEGRKDEGMDVSFSLPFLDMAKIVILLFLIILETLLAPNIPAYFQLKEAHSDLWFLAFPAIARLSQPESAAFWILLLMSAVIFQGRKWKKENLWQSVVDVWHRLIRKESNND